MKRTFVSFGMIVFFLIVVLMADLIFTTHYADGMLTRLNELESAADFESKKNKLENLLTFYEDNSFMAHRLIMTDRMDEIDMLLYRLSAFINAKEDYEVDATIAELKARVHSLYSTWFYHWYHPQEFGIE